MKDHEFNLIINRFDNIDKNIDQIKEKLDNTISSNNCKENRENCIMLKKKNSN